MTKEEILFWAQEYDKEEDLTYKNLERELGNKIRKTSKLTKKELKEIIRWKFQGQLKGRGEYKVKELEKEEGLKIQNLTEQALKTTDDKCKIRILTKIKQVGPAIASVILTFYDPKNYGVLDIHVWRELFGKEPKDLFDKNKDYYLKLITEMRKMAKKHNLPVRTIEKALFEKNRIENKNTKKKYKSTDKNLREIFGEEVKPELCPECGKEMFLLCISCGLLPCLFHYICPKCPREVILDKNGLVENKKLTQEEFIKKLERKEL